MGVAVVEVGDVRTIGYQEKGNNVVSRWLARGSGLLFMIAGALWVAWAIVHNMQPQGCVGSECSLPGRHMREGGPVDNTLITLSIVALVAGVIGLLIRARATGQFGRLGRVGLVLSGVGAATFLLTGIAADLFIPGDFPLPLSVVPELLALLIGFILLSIEIMRIGLLPRWCLALIIIGALSFIGADEQNSTILRAIPFGLACIVVGYVLQFRGRSGQPKTASVGESVAARFRPG
jgi:hypothetical protein